MVEAFPDWRSRGACRDYDPEWWFALRNSRQERLAMRICRQECPVVMQCYEYANRTGQAYGIWGGQNRDRAAAAPEPICAECGGPFTRSTNSQKFCSLNCRKRSERRTEKYARRKKREALKKR